MKEQDLSRKLCCALDVLESTGRDNRSQLTKALRASEELTRLLRERHERLWRPEQTAKPPYPDVPALSGAIRTTEYGWLHIRLDMLLPHCRYETPLFLTDTITRLLDGFARRAPLPFFRRAFVAIEEWSDIDTRRVFDQDNKGWKAIPNALKGVVTEDDDQYSMELALLSRRSRENCCHIFVLDAQDADAFFAWRTGQYGEYPGF